jgi:hypothetical protein
VPKEKTPEKAILSDFPDTNEKIYSHQTRNRAIFSRIEKILPE